MSETVARVIRRRGVVPALLTAVGILAYLVVSDFLSAVISSALFVGTGASADLGALWVASAVATISSRLPFALGVFLAFWQIAPIAASLRLAHVVTRAVLAAVVGAVLSFAVAVAVLLLRALVAGDLVGATGSSVLGLVGTTLGLVLTLAPLVVLGAILLWGWLQRHPRDYEVRGTLDEV
jgi:hypothetical protein